MSRELTRPPSRRRILPHSFRAYPSRLNSILIMCTTAFSSALAISVFAADDREFDSSALEP